MQMMNQFLLKTVLVIMDTATIAVVHVTTEYVAMIQRNF